MNGRDDLAAETVKNAGGHGRYSTAPLAFSFVERCGGLGLVVAIGFGFGLGSSLDLLFVGHGFGVLLVRFHCSEWTKIRQADSRFGWFLLGC